MITFDSSPIATYIRNDFSEWQSLVNSLIQTYTLPPPLSFHPGGRVMSDRREKKTHPLRNTHMHIHAKRIEIKSCVLSSDMLPFLPAEYKWLKMLWQGNKSILTGTLTKKNTSDKEDTTRWNEIKQRPLKELNTHPCTWQKKKQEKLVFSYRFWE